jgi:hypothetical protein
MWTRAIGVLCPARLPKLPELAEHLTRGLAAHDGCPFQSRAECGVEEGCLKNRYACVSVALRDAGGVAGWCSDGRTLATRCKSVIVVENDRLKFDAVIIGLLNSLFLILGVVLGAYLTHKSAQDLFFTQKRYEMRVNGYSDIVSLRIPLAQTMQTLVEAEMLGEFYNFRSEQVTHSQFDLDLAQQENKRRLGLIPEFSRLQRELFKAVAQVSVTYPRTQKIKDAIAEVYYFGTVVVPEPKREEIKSPEMLDYWKSQNTARIPVLVKQTLTDRIDKLISVLDSNLSD